MQFFKPIYDSRANKILLMTSRQSTKTTYLRNKLTTRSLTRAGNSALYVAPTGNQISDFSKKKLDTVFSHNPPLKDAFTSPKLDWNVTFKQFKVGDGISTINLRSTGGHQGAEGVRGGTYNDIFKDEYQSLVEEHIPVIDECAATFQGEDAPVQAFFCNTGTPLSFQNPIQKEWNLSKGYEWCIICPHCKLYNEPLGMHSLDTKKPYLFCSHCGKDMNRWPHGYRLPPKGEWVATNPNGKFPAFRVVRLMMPWAVWRNDNRSGILDRLEIWPERQFANEVMGLPYDSAGQPITEKDIKAICTSPDRLPSSELEMVQIAQKYASHPKFAGLDWAMNSDESTPSYTKFGISAYINGKLRLIFAHSFVGAGSSDPQEVLKKIGHFMDTFNVTMLACDFGVGYFENKRLMQQYPGRVITMHYTGSSQRVQTQYDAAGQKYMVPRTPSLDEFVSDVKRGFFELPDYENVKPFTNDWLNITIEISDKTRTVLYRRTGTDDFAHVGNYMNLAFRLYKQGSASAMPCATRENISAFTLFTFVFRGLHSDLP